MPSLSAFTYGLFEIANEMFIAVAAGATGALILLKHGIKTCQYFRTITVGAITIYSFYYICKHSPLCRPHRRKVVFISGCDSGLGFSMAQHAHDIGFTVLAGFLSCESPGARHIRKKYGDRIKQIELDITQIASVEAAYEVVCEYLESNAKNVLWALVNNAGVMVFGEFEWLTDRLIQHQLNVNLAGTLRLTKTFCPLIRKYKGRIITVTSHCAQATLPGLAVYGATKAGLSAWSDGLRVEMSKFGVKVITFIPGSFIQQSDIMAKQLENVQEMHSAFSSEQHNFYDDYFMRYNSYLNGLTTRTAPKKINDCEMYKEFDRALLEVEPKAHYIHEPPRYKFYHLLFRYSPQCMRDFFVKQFMQMPDYNAAPSSFPDVVA